MATNTARLGFGKIVRNHDSLAATDAERTSLAPQRRGSGHLPISNLANNVTARRAGQRSKAQSVRRIVIFRIMLQPYRVGRLSRGRALTNRLIASSTGC